MMRRVPSVEKLERLTAFRPRTTLPEIVDRVIAYFKSKPQMADATRVARAPGD